MGSAYTTCSPQAADRKIHFLTDLLYVTQGMYEREKLRRYLLGEKVVLSVLYMRHVLLGPMVFALPQRTGKVIRL
jgi:hypothetical protein